jgi:basic membrane protein A
LSTCRASGDLQLFAGPISENFGALRLPEGNTLTDEALPFFNRPVEGVVGQMPE